MAKENVQLSEGEVIFNLASDPDFALDFAIANQGEAIRRKIEGLLSSTIGIADVKAILIEWHNKKDVRFVEALDVPYDDAVNNWTQGFSRYFEGNPTLRSGEGSESGAAGLWGSILSGIGAFATSFGGALAGSGSGTNQQTQLLQLQMAEAERKRKQNNTIIVGAILVLAAVVGFVVYKKNKKGKSKK